MQAAQKRRKKDPRLSCVSPNESSVTCSAQRVNDAEPPDSTAKAIRQTFVLFRIPRRSLNQQPNLKLVYEIARLVQANRQH